MQSTRGDEGWSPSTQAEVTCAAATSGRPRLTGWHAGCWPAELKLVRGHRYAAAGPAERARARAAWAPSEGALVWSWVRGKGVGFAGSVAVGAGAGVATDAVGKRSGRGPLADGRGDSTVMGSGWAQAPMAGAAASAPSAVIAQARAVERARERVTEIRTTTDGERMAPRYARPVGAQGAQGAQGATARRLCWRRAPPRVSFQSPRRPSRPRRPRRWGARRARRRPDSGGPRRSWSGTTATYTSRPSAKGRVSGSVPSAADSRGPPREPRGPLRRVRAPRQRRSLRENIAGRERVAGACAGEREDRRRALTTHLNPRGPPAPRLRRCARRKTGDPRGVRRQALRPRACGTRRTACPWPRRSRARSWSSA